MATIFLHLPADRKGVPAGPLPWAVTDDVVDLCHG